jgi:hypothetical protein
MEITPPLPSGKNLLFFPGDGLSVEAIMRKFKIGRVPL